MLRAEKVLHSSHSLPVAMLVTSALGSYRCYSLNWLDILSNGNTGIGRPQAISSVLTGTQNTTAHGQGPWPSLNPMVS